MSHSMARLVGHEVGIVEPSAQVFDLAEARDRLLQRRPPEEHRFLYPARAWQSSGALRGLERMRNLRTNLSHQKHRRIHQTLAYIPPIPEVAASYVLDQFDASIEGPQESLSELTRLMGEAAYDFTNDVIEQRCVELTRDALGQQAVYLGYIDL